MSGTQKRNALFLIFSIFLFHCADAKKFGGGGGSRGGGSAARMNPQPHQPAPAGGGWGGGAPHGAAPAPHPGPAGGFGGAAGGFGGAAAGGGFRPQSAGSGPGHFGSGTGLGSASRGSSFKTALAGAAVGAVGGVLAFEAGKAIISSMDKPIQHDNRNYYWGPEYANKKGDEHVCSYDFQELMKQSAPPAERTPAANATTEQNAQALAQATFPNGTRPKTIVWTCKNTEQCCGTDCCPMPPQSVSRAENNHSSALSTVGKVLLIITLLGLLLCCCFGLIIYKFFRSVFDSLFSRDNNTYDPSKYENSTNAANYPQHQNNEPVQAQSYPMQPFPNQPPGATVYPAQPQAPPAYPTYPPAPGYYDGHPQKY